MHAPTNQPPPHHSKPAPPGPAYYQSRGHDNNCSPFSGLFLQTSVHCISNWRAARLGLDIVAGPPLPDPRWLTRMMAPCTTTTTPSAIGSSGHRPAHGQESIELAVFVVLGELAAWGSAQPRSTESFLYSASRRDLRRFYTTYTFYPRAVTAQFLNHNTNFNSKSWTLMLAFFYMEPQ